MKKKGFYILQLNSDETLPVQDSLIQLIAHPKTREPIETWDEAISIAADLAKELSWRLYQIVEIRMTASLDWPVDVEKEIG